MRFIFTMFFIVLLLPVYSQLVIEYDDFPQPESYEIFRFVADVNNVQIPAGGEDQIWDYSSLSVIDSSMTLFLSTEGDTTFPEAKYKTPSFLQFQGFIYDNTEYDGIDENGAYRVGSLPQDTSFSITQISGGPDDVIRFVGSPSPLDGRIDFIKFPLSYQDTWTESFIETTVFELTVAAFGLNMVPGSRKRTLTQTRTVVGWGELITPNREGGINEPREVLLVQASGITLDSFFLAGAPAPPPLIDAFGLTQGEIFENEFYLFFDQHDPSNLMRINIDGGEIISVFFKPDHNEISTSVSAVELIPSTVYPNPISPMQELTIQTDQDLTNGTFILSDMNGRQALVRSIDSLPNENITISMPGYLTPGLYVFQLISGNGNIRSIGKINVH